MAITATVGMAWAGTVRTGLDTVVADIMEGEFVLFPIMVRELYSVFMGARRVRWVGFAIEEIM